MLPFEIDWIWLLAGMIIAYTIYNFANLLKAYYEKRKAEKNLEEIQGKIKKIEGDLVTKQKELTERLKKLSGGK